MDKTSSKTFVLVHPAWFGGWCWQKITPLLRARGYDVYTPTLTGLGERAHLARPEIGLGVHIEDVSNLLKYEDLSDVVLVGNSSAGMVITGVADQLPERIAQVVYLDAFVPQDGQTMLDIMPPDRRPLMEALVQKEGQGWLLRDSRRRRGTNSCRKPGTLPMRQICVGFCRASDLPRLDISKNRRIAKTRSPKNCRAPTFDVCSGQMRYSTDMPKQRKKQQDGAIVNSPLHTFLTSRIRANWLPC